MFRKREMKSTEEKSDKRLEGVLVCLFKQKKVLVCAVPEGHNNKKAQKNW